MPPRALLLLTLVACDPGYEERHRQFRLDRDRERREAAGQTAATAPTATATEERTARPIGLPPVPSASGHAYADVDREMAKIRADDLAGRSTPAMVEKRMMFAERFQKEQRCEYAGVVGPHRGLAPDLGVRRRSELRLQPAGLRGGSGTGVHPVPSLPRCRLLHLRFLDERGEVRSGSLPSDDAMRGIT